MPELKFNKAADQKHEVKLESHLISAGWKSGCAFAGRPAAFEVRTALVGNGAKIKIKGKSDKGKKLGTIKDEIRGNFYTGEFEIPDDAEVGDQVSFEVELSKNGLQGQSETIPVVPAPKVTKMEWDVKEARRGDIVTLSADLENVRDGAEAKLTIYEYDADGAHDRICELPAIVTKKRVEVKWEYEYLEDTDEIATEQERQRYGQSYNPPEYFFVIEILGWEFGRQQESKLLVFKDWIEIILKDENDRPVPNEDYKIILPDGTEKQGQLDSEGRARVDGIPPGRFRVLFPHLGED